MAMTFEEDLAARVRAALAAAGAIREIRMFGGIGFMLNGNMVAAASKRGLLVRVGKERQARALKRKGARPMVMRERVMEGYVHIDPPDTGDEAVEALVAMAVAFVQTLPAKKAGSAAASRKRAPQRKS